MLKLRFSKQSDKFLKRVPAKHAKQISLRIQQLQQNEDLLAGSELKGYAPYRRYKSGEYRIIFKIRDETLFVTLIAKRNDDDVYKRIKRFLT